MVLETANPSERRIIQQHFQRENALKASLDSSEKKAFEADGNKASAKLLARVLAQRRRFVKFSQGNIALRRCAMVVVDWRVKDSADRQDARLLCYMEQ